MNLCSLRLLRGVCPSMVSYGFCSSISSFLCFLLAFSRVTQFLNIRLLVYNFCFASTILSSRSSSDTYFQSICSIVAESREEQRAAAFEASLLYLVLSFNIANLHNLYNRSFHPTFTNLDNPANPQTAQTPQPSSSLPASGSLLSSLQSPGHFAACFNGVLLMIHLLSPAGVCSRRTTTDSDLRGVREGLVDSARLDERDGV